MDSSFTALPFDERFSDGFGLFEEKSVKVPTAYTNLCFLIDLLHGLMMQKEDARHGRG